MRKSLLFIVVSTLLYSGGDISVITPYENDDNFQALQGAVEEEAPIPISTPKPTPIPFVKLPKEAIAPKVDRVYANGFYIGLGISGTRYHDGCRCNTGSALVKSEYKEKSVAVIARVGYDYNQYIGLEARGVKDFAEDNKASISHAGIFIKPMYPVTKELNLYGLIGMAKTKTSGDYPKVNSEALALGGGVEYDLSKDKPKKGKYNRDFDGEGDQERGFGLFLDYERMVVKKNAPLLDSVSAGVTYDF